MQVLPDLGENPVPRTNFRFGNPTPQQGEKLNGNGVAQIILCRGPGARNSMAISIKLESRHQDAQAELPRRLDDAPRLTC